jgi:hypothetical protein
MPKPHVGRYLSLCLLAVTLAGSATRAQQKYRLRDQGAAGDVSIEDHEYRFNVRFQATAPGGEARDFGAVFGERQRFREQVLVADANGAAAVRRTYALARETEPDASGSSKETVSSLEGKTITLRKHGDQVTVTVAKGKLDRKDEEALKDEEGGPSAPPFFPDRDVAPGDEWSPDFSRFVAAIGKGLQKATARARFQEVLDYSGHPCARIALDLGLTGQPEGFPAPITLQLSGHVYQALDLQRTLSYDLTGPVTAAVKGENGPAVTVSGQFMAKGTGHWSKVAGKPVVEKR